MAQFRFHAACELVRRAGHIDADGATCERLPLGIQAMGPQGADGLLLQLAAQIERAQGWNGGARPGVHVIA